MGAPADRVPRDRSSSSWRSASRARRYSRPTRRHDRGTPSPFAHGRGCIRPQKIRPRTLGTSRTLPGRAAQRLSGSPALRPAQPPRVPSPFWPLPSQTVCPWLSAPRWPSAGARPCAPPRGAPATRCSVLGEPSTSGSPPRHTRTPGRTHNASRRRADRVVGPRPSGCLRLHGSGRRHCSPRRPQAERSAAPRVRSPESACPSCPARLARRVREVLGGEVFAVEPAPIRVTPVQRLLSPPLQMLGKAGIVKLSYQRDQMECKLTESQLAEVSFVRGVCNEHECRSDRARKRGVSSPDRRAEAPIADDGAFSAVAVDHGLADRSLLFAKDQPIRPFVPVIAPVPASIGEVRLNVVQARFKPLVLAVVTGI